MEDHFGICKVSAAPVRAEPSDRAEMVTQLLFGDAVEILEQAAPWFRIRIAFDRYEGWMDFKQLARVSAAEYHAAQHTDFMVPALDRAVAVAADGSHFYLPASAGLPGFSGGRCRIGKASFDLLFEPARFTGAAADGQALTAAARFFLNAPYLWGGRTGFGIDCSGFVQAVYKLSGIALERDASRQAEQGTPVNFLPEAQPGDLAFFDNADGRIVHVGLMLNAGEIIHAAGQVRIDPVDDQGIWNADLRTHTHRLRIIKRLL